MSTVGLALIFTAKNISINKVFIDSGHRRWTCDTKKNPN